MGNPLMVIYTFLFLTCHQSPAKEYKIISQILEIKMVEFSHLVKGEDEEVNSLKSIGQMWPST